MRVTKADAREQKTKLDNVSEILKTGELIVISETLQIDLNRAKFAKWKYERKGRRRAAGDGDTVVAGKGESNPKKGVARETGAVGVETSTMKYAREFTPQTLVTSRWSEVEQTTESECEYAGHP